MSKTIASDAFMDEVRRLRGIYEKKRNSTTLVPPAGRPVLDLEIDVDDGVTRYTYWYERDDDDDVAEPQVVRIADVPGTLSGAILRLEADLPSRQDSYEIVGNEIRPLESLPPLPNFEDDFEDLSDVLSTLPEIAVDPERHFVKKGKYASEVRNLVACQGGSCPGTRMSPHIVQLLGKSPRAELVFEKLFPRYVLAKVHPLAAYKAWILQLVAGLRCLHSLDIVHRDIRIDNFVFSKDGSRLVICDLESRWGNRLAPEVKRDYTVEGDWTKASDIFDLGVAIRGMVYGNTPITNVVEWPVPSPLDKIVEACTRALPEERPSLDEVHPLVDGIEAT
ncbi:Protein kinase-like domain protein [Niveomyces insectorum RCEF 264]|uniref:EKC/KEOPS complex subunit BUD32 n=1 Tax=Niveomyces insectorum RCEF 264 TaxID=1081102 RepID=A0A167WDI3_9HYPO|nr:Protein kinase-like domain protein [Niveomyces insectorum RCEF 264]